MTPGRRTARALIEAGERLPCAPWPRYRLSPPDWAELAERLADDPLALRTMWSDGESIHALFFDGDTSPLLASVPVDANRFLALSPARPAAEIFERSIRDLWGIEAMAARDLRPWLDHSWPVTRPLAARPGPASWPPESPELLFDPADEQRGRFQLGAGPVLSRDAAPCEGPAHLRATLDGSTVVRLETRRGYAHRGIAALLRGRTPPEAMPVVSRIASDATVAHQLAFCRAVEAATGQTVPPSAVRSRRMLLELERIAVHLADLGAILAAAAAPGAANAVLDAREHWVRQCGDAFGHRLLMDRIVPGGVALPAEPSREAEALAPMVAQLSAALPDLERTVERVPFLSGRLAAQGIVAPALAVRLGLGGVAGRASGQRFDLRHLPDGDGAPSVARSDDGDVQARMRLRFREIAHALSALAALPERDVPAPRADTSTGEGVGAVEAARGDLWHWVRIRDGRIEAWHAQDPAAVLWTAFEAAAVGATPDGLALLGRSLGLSAAGSDL